MSDELPKSKVLSPERVAALLDDVRAGMSGPDAVVKYGVSKGAIQRTVYAAGLHFDRPSKVPEDAIREAILSGMSIWQVARTLGVHDDRARRVRREMGLQMPREARAESKEELIRRCVELAPTHTTSGIAILLGCSQRVVRRHLHDQGVSAAPRPVRRALVEPSAPLQRTPRVPKPAPIKRPKRGVKREPLFDVCPRKHPITPSNRMQGTEKGCLVCRKRGINLSLALVPARDAMIADLLRVIEKEVAELTAELRPEEEKAA